MYFPKAPADNRKTTWLLSKARFRGEPVRIWKCQLLLCVHSGDLETLCSRFTYLESPIHHRYLTQLKPSSPFSMRTAYSWSHQELFLFSLKNEWEFLKSMALGIFSAYSEVIGILYRKLRFWTTFFLTSSLLCKEAVVFSLRNSHSSASCSRKYFNNLHCVLGTGYSSVSRKQAFLNALFTLSTKKN